MGEERLSGLALMNIYPEVELDIDIFTKKMYKCITEELSSSNCLLQKLIKSLTIKNRLLNKVIYTAFFFLFENNREYLKLTPLKKPLDPCLITILERELLALCKLMQGLLDLGHWSNIEPTVGNESPSDEQNDIAPTSFANVGPTQLPSEYALMYQ